MYNVGVRRRILTFTAALSLVLFIAMALMWVRSYWVADHFWMMYRSGGAELFRCSRGYFEAGAGRGTLHLTLRSRKGDTAPYVARPRELAMLAACHDGLGGRRKQEGEAGRGTLHLTLHDRENSLCLPHATTGPAGGGRRDPPRPQPRLLSDEDLRQAGRFRGVRQAAGAGAPAREHARPRLLPDAQTLAPGLVAAAGCGPLAVHGVGRHDARPPLAPTA